MGILLPLLLYHKNHSFLVITPVTWAQSFVSLLNKIRLDYSIMFLQLYEFKYSINSLLPDGTVKAYMVTNRQIISKNADLFCLERVTF